MIALRRVLAAVVVAGAVAVSPSPAQAEVGGFDDVFGNEFYGAAVVWLREAGLTTGCSPSAYCPTETVTRAQLVTFLWRLQGEPTGHPESGFTDVPQGTFYEPAVRWAKATGLTTGVGGSDRFEPDSPLTRAQHAAFLWRFDGEPGPYAHHGFDDVPAGSYYDEAVRWLKGEGITTGVSPTQYGPDEPLTRGQLATFVWRYSGSPPPENPGDTVDCGDFATHDEAQGWYELYLPYYGDVASLDSNSDGVACESLL